MIVDDEDPIRENLRRFLTLEGHDIVEAANGARAVELLQDEVPDLVLCDLMMPEIDGYGVLESLRGNARTASVPFVFLTASAEKSEREQCLTRGANGYLAKPFSLADLKALLAEHFPAN